MMSFTCTDINECENPQICNRPGESCINGIGNYTCSCIKGYRLDRIAGLCVTNQSSLQVNLLIGKYTYFIALSHVWVNMHLELHLIV